METPLDPKGAAFAATESASSGAPRALNGRLTQLQLGMPDS
jgi:hypothetical protein